MVRRWRCVGFRGPECRLLGWVLGAGGVYASGLAVREQPHTQSHGVVQYEVCIADSVLNSRAVTLLAR